MFDFFFCEKKNIPLLHLDVLRPNKIQQQIYDYSIQQKKLETNKRDTEKVSDIGREREKEIFN